MAQVRQACSEDWDKGGRLFFGALKGGQNPPVDAIDRVDNLAVRSLKTKKKGDATFRMADDDLHMVRAGQSWRQAQAWGVVAEIHAGLVSVKMVEGVIKTGQVRAFTTCTGPAQSLPLAVDCWSSSWKSTHHINSDDPQIEGLVSGLPQIDPLSPCITMPELNAALHSLSTAKARGMDAFQTGN